MSYCSILAALVTNDLPSRTVVKRHTTAVKKPIMLLLWVAVSKTSTSMSEWHSLDIPMYGAVKVSPRAVHIVRMFDGILHSGCVDTTVSRV